VLGAAPAGTTGVQGFSDGAGPTPPQGTAGIGGQSSSGYGVVGSSTSNYGVFGISTASGSAAVVGLNGFGGPGVVGYSPNATGVGGGTDTGIGFGGVAASTGTGVQGQSAEGTAIVGAATGASNLSAYFTGGDGVVVNGNFTVIGGVKSAAVRGADGSLRRLYCVESPESWFEDFGHGQLTNGTATVPLEPGFAGLVKTDDYHVFLTPQGESKGWLYVSSKTVGSFTVYEAGNGASNVTFDYRVVAKRKDIAGARLERVDEPPVVQRLKLPELPATPLPPPTPTPPGHGR
jgi:hypothetical protein